MQVALIQTQLCDKIFAYLEMCVTRNFHQLHRAIRKAT
jgi:hypothetical protein